MNTGMFRTPCRLTIASVSVTLLAGALVTGAAASTPASPASPTSTSSSVGMVSTGPYAPLDRPGPPLSVSAADLAASLTCSLANPRTGSATPVLLVPGTTQTPETNFSWNYERAFTANGTPWCAVTLPGAAMDDITTAGEYVTSAIRTLHSEAGRKIDILGFSQGGMVPRWSLRFWPDIRTDVDDFVAIDPSNHGTLDAYPVCAAGCAPAFWQQQSGSQFLSALNTGPETFEGISYTVVYSRVDEVVVPNFDAQGSSALHTGQGQIVNVAAQQICPLDTSEHLEMGSTDPVAYALAEDAFTHAGPAVPSRISSSTCLEGVQPGVNKATLATDEADYLAQVAAAIATTPFVPAEPALPSYVYATPAAAATAS